MSELPSRRAAALGLAAAALAGANAAAQPAVPRSAPARPDRPPPSRGGNIFSRGREDRFQTLFEQSRGVSAAQFGDFAMRTPGGRACRLRVAWPVAPERRMPVIAMSPGDGASGIQYDLFTGALAAQGYFVMTPDTAPVPRGASVAERERAALTRAAELRYLLDSIQAVQAIAGPGGEGVDPGRIGVCGHGEGAWTALGLIGWGRDFQPSGATMDGRVRAAFALAPPFQPQASVPSEARPLIGGRGMVAGRLDRLPTPPAGSRLLGMGLPVSADTFGGLLGPPTPGSRPAPGDRDALAAAAAAAVMFFDWAVMGEQERRRALYALDGRRFGDMSAPLQIREA